MPNDSGKYRPRFSFSPSEKKALLTLATLFTIGLLGTQVRNWVTSRESTVTIIGGSAVDSSRVSSFPAEGETKQAGKVTMRDATNPEDGKAGTRPSGEDLHHGAIDINQASVSQLTELPGIGPVLASRVVQFRSLHGSFLSVDDLLLIKGIGKKTLDKIRPYIMVSP